VVGVNEIAVVVALANALILGFVSCRLLGVNVRVLALVFRRTSRG